MRDLHELSWSEGTEAIMALLGRLTAMRGLNETKPVKKLLRCCAAIIEGDIRQAADACFAMTAAMLEGGSRRVTGELFLDMLLDELFLKPHPFARMAAANRLDEALYNAMREDLDVLYSLRGLDGATLYRFIQERYKEIRQRVRPNKDPAARMAEAAWGGGAVRPSDDNMQPMPLLPVFLPAEGPNWHYGEEELRDQYAADEALEEMYHRFLEDGFDWSGMTEDLWNFFAAYGAGEFLKQRLFTLRGCELAPLEDRRLVSAEPILEQEHRMLLNCVIEFMRGDDSDPLLIVGAEGMGKTTMLFSMADELPELRFIYAPGCRSLSQLAPLFETLSKQPLKFMLALDEPEISGFALRTVPANVLLIAASTDMESVSGRVFTRRVTLPQLRLDGFSDIVQKLLDRRGVLLPKELVRSACVDHQVDSKGELTVAAAVSLAVRLAKTE